MIINYTDHLVIPSDDDFTVCTSGMMYFVKTDEWCGGGRVQDQNLGGLSQEISLLITAYHEIICEQNSYSKPKLFVLPIR